MQYCVSAASPGAGSGPHTRIRPSEHGGGRPSGHLFRDSSIYDLAVVPGEGTCVYELRIPLAEIGIQGTASTKSGFSAQLNDNDGRGPAARINWGEGLHPSWAPEIFGVATLVE